MELTTLRLKGALMGLRMNEVSWSQLRYLHVILSAGNTKNYQWFPLVEGKFSITLEAPLSYEAMRTIEYTAALQLGIDECLSIPLPIHVHRLWIEKFEDLEAPQKNFVVVDRPIRHEAKAAADCHSFEWELRSKEKQWILQNQYQKNSDQMQIEKSSIVNKSTSDFGIKHGIIRVSCKDATGRTHIVSSYKLVSPHADTNVNSREMPNKFYASVFFKKDDAHPGYAGYIPNWFPYWLSPIQTNIKYGTNHYEFIDLNKPEFQKYSDLRAFYNPVVTPEFHANHIYMTRKASEDHEYNLKQKHPKPTIVVITSGIHTCTNTVYHEQEHHAIWLENWPNGYDSNQDLDLDLYNDNWELKHDQFKFAIRQLGVPDLEDKYDINNKFSNGTKYEEARCEEIEVLFWLSGKTKENDPFDWSFDPLTLNQGKQWK